MTCQKENRTRTLWRQQGTQKVTQATYLWAPKGAKTNNTAVNESIVIETTPAVAAWREIFGKYRIRLIQQATTVTTNQVHQVQPILIKQDENKEIGDTFIPAEDGIFRIYYQNVNGVSARKGMSKWNKINDTMAKHNVAIFGLTKTNIEWNMPQTNAHMKATLRKHFAHTIMETSTSTMKFEEDYKPGGTCTVTTNNWTG